MVELRISSQVCDRSSKLPLYMQKAGKPIFITRLESVRRQKPSGSADIVSLKMCLNKDTFLYFAYGSNLLNKRIHINNPSAQFLGIGQLESHQLDFAKYSENWRGAVATIVPRDGEQVWGAIWKLHNDDLPALDKQEGVETKEYFAKKVNIMTRDGIDIECRTYQHTYTPPIRKEGEELPFDRRPSITYLEAIIKGATECQLPKDYIDELRNIPNNGKLASPDLLQKL